MPRSHSAAVLQRRRVQARSDNADAIGFIFRTLRPLSGAGW
jgi:hypothetical protein